MAVLERFRRSDLEPAATEVLARLETGERGGNRRLLSVFRGSRNRRKLFASWARERFEQAVAAGEVEVAAEEPPIGRFQKFIEFLLAHKEEIIAFIKMILGMGAVAALESTVEISDVMGQSFFTGEEEMPQKEAIFGLKFDVEGVARKILEIIKVAKRVGIAAEVAVQAFVDNVWPIGQIMPNELKQAIVKARQTA